MKAYQVFTGDFDKHNQQDFDLDSTYFDKERALQRCREIIGEDRYENETIEESEWYNDGKSKCWDILGWEWVTVCKFEEIEITE